MKRFSGLVLTVLIIIAFVSCSGKPGSGGSMGSSSGNAAMVGDVAITMGELNEAAKSQLQKVGTQVYRIKKRVLDGLIEEKLVESAAKKAGKNREEFLKAEIEEKIKEPSDKEVKALYEARKGRFKQPLEEVKGQIVAYLMNNRLNHAKQELMARLMKEENVKVMLEAPRIEIDISGAPAQGKSNAKVTLVEFSDYQCPFCKRVRPTIWRLMDEYKDQVQYVFMDFPLSFHRQAQKAHEAALCANEQDKYFEYNKKIFNDQKNLEVSDLKKYAKELGLDTKKFDKCLDDGKLADTVRSNVAKGVEAGVSGTPAFFINGIMLSGAQPYAVFKEIIEDELNR